MASSRSQMPFISVMALAKQKWPPGMGRGRRKGLINSDARRGRLRKWARTTVDFVSFHSCDGEESCPEGTRGATRRANAATARPPYI